MNKQNEQVATVPAVDTDYRNAVRWGSFPCSMNTHPQLAKWRSHQGACHWCAFSKLESAARYAYLTRRQLAHMDNLRSAFFVTDDGFYFVGFSLADVNIGEKAFFKAALKRVFKKGKDPYRSKLLAGASPNYKRLMNRLKQGLPPENPAQEFIFQALTTGKNI